MFLLAPSSRSLQSRGFVSAGIGSVRRSKVNLFLRLFYSENIQEKMILVVHIGLARSVSSLTRVGSQSALYAVSGTSSCSISCTLLYSTRPANFSPRLRFALASAQLMANFCSRSRTHFVIGTNLSFSSLAFRAHGSMLQRIMEQDNVLICRRIYDVWQRLGLSGIIPFCVQD